MEHGAVKVELGGLVSYLEALFDPALFSDPSLNGLQVEGRSEVSVVATAVDAGLEAVEGAIAVGADLLFVHHGLFWERPRAVTGSHKRLLERCFQHSLNIYALHLPLDAHAELGNNALLAHQLELKHLEPAAAFKGKTIGWKGENGANLTLAEMKARLESLPGVSPSLDRCWGGSGVLALPFGPERPKRVCIVSGSAADTVTTFAAEGFDTFVTGEPKQFVYHFCRENNLNAIFAGHYATETVGVRAVGERLAFHFGLRHQFLDLPTGI